MRIQSIEKIIEELKLAHKYAEPWNTALERLKLRELEISHQYALYYHHCKEDGNEPLPINKWLDKRKEQKID